MGRWGKRAALSGGALLLVLAGAFALDRAFPPDLSRLERTGTEVLDRNGRLLAVLPAPGGVWRLRTEADQVSRPFLDLLVATEDRHFWHHPGVNPLALARAAVQWVRAGRVVSGGSTLSMQAARLLEPRPRTLRSKAIEIARALQLEWRYGKQGVLGVWLTLAPYGGNLEGVRAGARAWFGVGAAALDPAQAALLVAIPRRPEGLRPDRFPDRAAAVRDRVLGEAEGVPVPQVRQAFPRHAAQPLAGLAVSGAPVVRTTLDLPLQAALERLVRDRLITAPERVSAAVLVADLRTREVRAAVSGGGGDARAGALDLTRAVRSPGSALKPFLYGLAFRDGVVTPGSTMRDLPRRYGEYAPENYGGLHAGTITAAEALRRSLNGPAVALLDQVGPTSFLQAVRGAGAKLVLPAGAEPSLPLALGGVGTTVRDLAALYAALGSDGGGGPLLWSPGRFQPRPFLTPEHARITADAITQAFPGGGPAGVAWKTGTSWGGRDAWAGGFDSRHAVVVWMGRPDGTPVPGATGRGLALPLLARVFEYLPPAPRQAQPAIRAAASTTGDTLRLLFPPPGAVLPAGSSITLRAMGGRRPLAFLVDGAPVAAQPAQRQATWTPAGPGYYQVSVIDSDGEAARAGVVVRE